jgi:hypothetical protein
VFESSEPARECSAAGSSLLSITGEDNIFESSVTKVLGSSDSELEVENTEKGPRCWALPSPEHSSSSAKRAVTSAEDKSIVDGGADVHN